MTKRFDNIDAPCTTSSHQAANISRQMLEASLAALQQMPDPKTIVASIEATPVGKMYLMMASNALDTTAHPELKKAFSPYFGVPVLVKNDLPVGVMVRCLNADGDVLHELKTSKAAYVDPCKT